MAWKYDLMWRKLDLFPYLHCINKRFQDLWIRPGLVYPNTLKKLWVWFFLSSTWQKKLPLSGNTPTHTPHTHMFQLAGYFIASPWGVRWDCGSMELFTVCLLGPNSLAQHDWRCPSQPRLSVLILSRCRRRAPWTPGRRRPAIRSFTGGESPPHLP